MEDRGTPSGQVPCKEIPNYDPPTRVGSHVGPGLGGTNHGTSGTQGPNSPQQPIGPGQRGPYRR